jgi:drug/metabolite transporter (DMT)-like permease
MASSGDPSSEDKGSKERLPAGFLQVMGAVFWSFFGVRKRALGERDMVTLKPAYVVLAGLLGAAILVALVATLVHFITRGQ